MVTTIKRWLKEYALPILLVAVGLLEEITGTLSAILPPKWLTAVQVTMGVATFIVALIKKIKIERKKQKIRTEIKNGNPA